MFEKILGKSNSLQRSLIKEFIIAFLGLLILSILIFYTSINLSMSKKLKDINIKEESIDGKEIVWIVQKSIMLSIGTSVLFIVVVMGYHAKKILGPINKINKATKEISSGNFDIQLESYRKDEIGELTRNFNLMAKDLSKIEVIQKDFINNMSHELKTPISSIKGFAQLLQQEGTTEEEKKEYISIIVEESDRLLNISNNILKLSKLQNKEKIENKTDINISRQIEKVLAMLENKRAAKNIKIQCNLPEITIKGNEELLYQVWTNLIDNSIKFTNNNGQINIDVRKKGNIAVITIQDNGIGMTEEEKRKVFERFYQVDESHYSEGSGLGLSIVKRIVDLSGGDISIESKKGKGSTFKIELPCEKSKNKSKIKIN